MFRKHLRCKKCLAVKGMRGTEAGSNRSAENNSDDRDRDELVGVENEGETDEERRWTRLQSLAKEKAWFSFVADWSKIDQDMFLK